MIVTFTNKDGSNLDIETPFKGDYLFLNKAPGGLVYLKTAWCREVTTVNLRNFNRIIRNDDILVNIYGIRSRYGAGYQPRNIPFIKNRPASVTRAIKRWTLDITNLIGKRLGTSPQVPPSIYLNTEHAGGISKLVGIPGRILGSLEGIPISWLESTAVMSLILLLPRLWGALAAHKEYLRLKSRIKDRFGSPLWRKWGANLIYPTWSFTDTPASLWTFLYILAGNLTTAEERDLCDGLLTVNRSGLASWVSTVLHYDKSYLHSAKDVFERLEENGPGALFRLPRIMSW